MRNRLLLLAALLLAIVALSSCSSSQSGDNASPSPEGVGPLPRVPPPDPEVFTAPGFRYELSFSFEPSTEPRTAKVYRVVAPHVDEAYARSVMKGLSLDANVALEDKSELARLVALRTLPCYRSENKEGRIEVEIDGTILYKSWDEPTSEEEDGFLTPVGARRIAERILSDVGLLPAGDLDVEVHGGGSDLFVVVIGYAGVRPDSGSMPLATLLIGQTGKLYWLYGSLPTIVPLGDYPLQSELEASEKISALGLFADWQPTTLTFSSSKMLYHRATSKDGTVFLVPCYRFFTERAYSACVPVVREEYVLPLQEGWYWRERTPTPVPGLAPDVGRSTA